MKLLLDTHILLWAANDDQRLSAEARQRMLAPQARLFFSGASIWEVVIKHGLGRPDFVVDPFALWQGLRADGGSVRFARAESLSRHPACTQGAQPPVLAPPLNCAAADAFVNARTATSFFNCSGRGRTWPCSQL